MRAERDPSPAGGRSCASAALPASIGLISSMTQSAMSYAGNHLSRTSSARRSASATVATICAPSPNRSERSSRSRDMTSATSLVPSARAAQLGPLLPQVRESVQAYLVDLLRAEIGGGVPPYRVAVTFLAARDEPDADPVVGAGHGQQFVLDAGEQAPQGGADGLGDDFGRAGPDPVVVDVSRQPQAEQGVVGQAQRQVPGELVHRLATPTRVGIRPSALAAR